MIAGGTIGNLPAQQHVTVAGTSSGNCDFPWCIGGDMATVLCVGGETLHTRHPLLKHAGFDVLTANSERASLAVGRLAKVDAVVLDSHANISSLPELATELKAARPNLPIVLVTDAGVGDLPEPAIGFDRVLSRLDGPKVLISSLRELTGCVISTSDWTRRSAREVRDNSQKLRQKMAEMRDRLSHLQQRFSGWAPARWRKHKLTV
jgi:response regulator RpfG family c-di-GMP phosphodiesterase